MDTQKKDNQKRKITQIIVAVIAFALAFFGTQYFLKDNKNLTDEMQIFADGINEECPVKVDKYSRLDSVTVIDEKTFQYNYTLLDVAKAEVNLDTANKYIKPGLIEQAKSKPYLKPFRDNKVTFIHHYLDKNGEFVTDMKVTPEIYLEE